MAIQVGFVPAANGCPATSESAPLVAPTVKTETLPDPEFTAKTKVPVGSTPIDIGLEPDANGLPITGATAPVVESIANADTVVPALSATKRKRPFGSIANDRGYALPVATGLADVIVREPVVGLTA